MVPIKAAFCLGTGGRVIKAIQYNEDTVGVDGGWEGWGEGWRRGGEQVRWRRLTSHDPVIIDGLVNNGIVR